MARLLVAPSDDIDQAVFPAGREAAGRGLAALLEEAAGGTGDITVELLPHAGTGALRHWVEQQSRSGHEGAGHQVAGHEAAGPVSGVVLSLRPDILSPSRTPEATEADLVALAVALDDRFGAMTVVLNCSSYDPADLRHTYAGEAGESLPLRTHRFDVALIRASQRAGLSVLDVDSLVAEAGGADHVPAALTYSRTVSELIGRELARQLAEGGAVPQAGDVFALRLPRYDRRVTCGVITAWRKQPGEEIAYGDELLEMRADNLGWRVEDDQRRRTRRRGSGRSLGLLVRAGGAGVLRRVEVGEGMVVRVGEQIGVVSAEVDSRLPEGSPLAGPSFPARVSALAEPASGVVT